MSKLIKKAFHASTFNIFKRDDNPAPGETTKTEPIVPDREQLRLAARRRAAKRGGGRASTVLSDRLGP